MSASSSPEPFREFLARDEVTELCRIRSRFGIMAYHGGNLERTTDAIATAVADKTGASLYTVTQDSPHRHHLPSITVSPQESESLRDFLAHVEIVVTVHGYGRKRLWRHLLLGGRNRALADHVAKHLRSGLSWRYRVVDDLESIPRPLRGQHARNPVNHPPECGVQIELPPTLRWNRKEWGWSDHEGVSRAPEVDRLIDALAAAISSWPA
ncbi:MAG: poly-gamma-glutamate hydrolase family protein [Myxococcota bacterium]